MTALEKAELIKCRQDPIYFIRTYVKIQHPMLGLIPFALYPYQEEMIRSLETRRKLLILKSRQMGITECTAQYCLWLCLFHKDKIVTAFSKDKAAAGEIIRRVQIAYRELPRFIKALAKPIRDNVYSIVLSNRSIIEAFGRTDDAGRSKAASLIVFDEAAIIRNAEDMWTAVRPIISSSGGKAVVMSTPRGYNWFQTMCQSAINAQEQERLTGTPADWHFMELPWHSHPEHDEAWFKRETADMSPTQIAQEYVCSFLSSGETLVDSTTLKTIHDSIAAPIRRELDNKLWWWSDIDPEREYVVAVDPSRGDSADLGAIQIFDVESGQQIAEYQDRKQADELAIIVLELARKCNNAFIIADVTGLGVALLKMLQLTGYDRLYWWEKGTANVYKNYAVVVKRQTEMKTKFIPGFVWTGKNRPQLVNSMELNLRKERIAVYSRRLYDELLRFKWIDGKAQADNGAHDDLTMALALAAWCISKESSNPTGQINQKIVDAINTNIQSRSEFNDVTQQIAIHTNNRDHVDPRNAFLGDPLAYRRFAGLLR